MKLDIHTLESENETPKKDIKSMLPEEIAAELKGMGAPVFRAKQIFEWISRDARSFDDMSNLTKPMRAELSERFGFFAPSVLRKQVSGLDGTVKYLWSLADGNAVESVVMSYKHGNTVCVSSQVGCRMGCAFCASAIGGLVRNLSPSEMLDQVLFSESDFGEAVSNVVIMGIGEPLDNLDNVLRFIRLVNHPEGRGIGMRHITLSTCGLTEMFDKLGENNLQLNLAVSLHAPDDETRNKIVPANRGRGVDELFSACAGYFEKTGRRVTFEYAMIDSVNDTDAHARLLAKKMRQLSAHVNLIPLNGVLERSFSPSDPARIRAFEKILTDAKINVTVRRRLGSDIDASCGQLRKNTVFPLKKEEEQ